MKYIPDVFEQAINKRKASLCLNIENKGQSVIVKVTETRKDKSKIDRTLTNVTKAAMLEMKENKSVFKKRSLS